MQFLLHISSFLLYFLLWILIQPSEGIPTIACDPTNRQTKRYLFCKESFSMTQRVSDLIGRLTLPEKIKLLVNNAAGVPRLGINRYEWWSEALHGVSNVGPGVRFGGRFPAATSFPQVITTAASFNSSLWEHIGRVVSDEARAMYNEGKGGLTFWSPNVNIFRDPRWGRGQETPGEDPVLVGRYATSYVRGLQGYGMGNRLKVAACCKHYTAYDLDNWDGIDRFHFNAKVHKRDLEDTYNIPFEECVVQGKVASVMCSYNQVNGKPTCADPYLLRNIIRKKWRLNGYIVSDCDSVEVLYNYQHYTATPEEAVAKTIKAGLDLDCGPFLALHTEMAVEKGLLKEAHINRALAHTIRVQMRLGLFDSPKAQPYSNLGPDHVCSGPHRRLAHDAARQGIVLLLNRGSVLPLSLGLRPTLAVIGPNSEATVTMIGNYAGIPCGYVSPADGIRRYARVVHQLGCRTVACDRDDMFRAAETAAQTADGTVLVMGLDETVEAEGKDRVGLLLPGRQQELVTRVAKASTGPTILVLMCGGPVDVSFAKNDPHIHAILWVGYPGQAGGAALADILFGKFSPEGRLPITWYPQSYVDKVSMTTMSMRANPGAGYPGRTHRFYRGPVVFPFGYGLSYTTFIHRVHVRESITFLVPYTNSTIPYRGVTIPHKHCLDISMVVKVDVINSGCVDSSHVVLLFWEPPSGYWDPTRRMVGFEKVFVTRGMVKRVTMTIDVCKHMNVIDVVGDRRIPVGGHVIRVGDVEKVVHFNVIKHMN